MFCPVPQSVMKMLSKIIYEYLWGSKVNKVKQEKKPLLENTSKEELK